MEFDLTLTAGTFATVVAVGVGGLAAAGVMELGTVLLMVLPSAVAFGLVCLALGVRYGEYRAGRSGTNSTGGSGRL